MNTMDDVAAELEISTFNPLDFLLDIDDGDEGFTVSAELPPTPLINQSCQPPPQGQEQEQEQQNAKLVQTGGRGNNLPKLDVAAVSTFSLDSSNHLIAGFPAPRPTKSPITFSRDPSQDHTSGNLNTISLVHSFSPVSSPQNISQSFSSLNVYSSISNPPLCARALLFRDTPRQKSVPPNIESEESTGIFVGQLPSSYTEDDIEALLKAIGRERGKIVQVRDVKCHNRDRTCAFVMINAGALAAILDFTKRVLCDINCVWIVEPNRAAQLPLFIQQMPREQLRGVPKAALVLEKLTPQSKLRHSGHRSNAGTSPGVGFSLLQGRLMNLMQPNLAHMLPPPVFLHQQGASASAATRAGYLDVSTLPSTSSFGGSNYVLASSMNNLPQFFGTSSLQPGAPSSAILPAGLAPSPNSVYATQMKNGSIANIEVANQMMIAASRSRAECRGYHVNPVLPCTSGKDSSAPMMKPTTVTLQSALQSEHCSCGQMLLLSQYPERGCCAKCQWVIPPNDVAYWCLSGHIAVCTCCSIKSNKSQSKQDAMRHQVLTDFQVHNREAGAINRSMN
ncbi:hypothetical protein JKF63_02460 [Porcisia hertigi]|uniref:RRM domain-containing protein n=1 Tax=Porcisia hertigi TaxID=2761500 RepID=A0A836L2T3_9TRYP|nr:hypothetical protein JKF63_02460 [Porcisia hertigi]